MSMAKSTRFPKVVGDGGLVRGETIAGDLEAARGDSIAHAFDECVGGPLIALADGNIQNKLGVAFDGNEYVGVAQVLIVLRPKAFLFLADEIPDFINLNILRLYIADMVRHYAFTLLASKNKQLEDGIAV